MVRFSRYALLFGNFAVGLTILGPAGMLSDLANGLAVSIAEAGLLVSLGGVVLCVASPIMTSMLSGVDRRTLLSMALLVLAVGNFLSAVSPDYWTLLAVRLFMLALGAVFTPLAASTVALMTIGKERAGAIAFVFMGWSLAIAAGLPLVTLTSASFGWRETHGLIGAFSLLGAIWVMAALPLRLKGAPVSLAGWTALGRNRSAALLFLITVLFTAAQYVIFPFLGHVLSALADADTQSVAALFGIFGVMGFIGNLIAVQVVKATGPFLTSATAVFLMLIGMVTLAFGPGSLAVMAAGIVLWGFGFAAANSMQQVRLVTAAPTVSSVAIALNASWIFVGQAAGTAVGSTMLSKGFLPGMAYVSAGLMALAVGVVLLTREANLTAKET